MPPDKSGDGDAQMANVGHVCQRLLSSCRGRPDRHTIATHRTGDPTHHSRTFPPPACSGHLGGKDPISAKKLEAGNTQWGHTKELLGFIFNGKVHTVHLTQGKAAEIADDTAKLLKRKEWHFTDISQSLEKCVTSPKYWSCLRRWWSLYPAQLHPGR
ncbi:hypothetical protein MHU86_5522 [Fragilaria crotonensis]|nr:hypothetical protein MHU86_5522 [Fragilaria crotonensis]